MSINIFKSNPNLELALQNVGTQISAGVPSPAEDYLESMQDLNRELIKNPSSTFYGRVKGLSMKDAGVDSGDLWLIVIISMSHVNGF